MICDVITPVIYGRFLNINTVSRVLYDSHVFLSHLKCFVQLVLPQHQLLHRSFRFPEHSSNL